MPSLQVLAVVRGGQLQQWFKGDSVGLPMLPPSFGTTAAPFLHLLNAGLFLQAPHCFSNPAGPWGGLGVAALSLGS